MRIKYIAWKQVIASDVLRLIYGIQGDGIDNRGDQAIQNFGTINENPGLWSGFTGGLPIPRKKEVERNNGINNTNNPTTFDIELKNSDNPLRLWQDKNDARKNPIKINHEIWDRNSGHEKAIINIWYLGYMRLLNQLLERLIERDGNKEEYLELKRYVDSRLLEKGSIEGNISEWIKETQDGFCALSINTNFLKNENIKDIKSFVEDSYYLVVKCEEDEKEFNLALMANCKSSVLHSGIKMLLQESTGRSKSGGKDVNIIINHSVVSSDAQEILNCLLMNKNVILYGPPGTGKTRILLEIQEAFSKNVIYDQFDTEAPFKRVSNITGTTGENKVKWCTFHSNYNYENFVFGLRPKVFGNRLAFNPHVGPMLEQCIESNKGNKTLLIIDEINRGNTDDIFGDTIAFLDAEFSGKLEFSQEFKYDDQEYKCVEKPDNLFILGTMNSVDKSVNPLSLNLKSKFYIKEVLPNTDVLRSALKTNIYISDGIQEFCCLLMENINERIRKYCGKEYQMGQGYFWALTNNMEQEAEIDIMADIIRNKMIPHLKEIIPNDLIPDFFSGIDQEILYTKMTWGYEYVDVSNKSAAYIINVFSNLIGSNYTLDEDEAIVFTGLEEYNDALISNVYSKLKNYHNIILKGVSGTGKTFITNEIIKRYFEECGSSKMFWHSTTEYSDVIEGISARAKDDTIDYSVESGAIKRLSESDFAGDKIMIIEGINKSNAAENFGELITLLEADKRTLSINGLEGAITMPANMYLICTLNPNVENQYRLDSALKRRFHIIDLKPDYNVLYLKYKLDAKKNINLDADALFGLDSSKVLQLAIALLKCINDNIKLCLGEEYQIGQAIFCGLPSSCTINDVMEVFDTKIFPYIEEYCRDEYIANVIFGLDSPLVRKCVNFVEVLPFWYLPKEYDEESVLEAKIIAAFKGLLSNGTDYL